MSNGKKSFFTTLPGILTGFAALIGAVASLYVALKNSSQNPPEPQPSAIERPIAVPKEERQNSFAEHIRGIWLNENKTTRGITKVVIMRRSGNVFIRAWGKCHPKDCNWGEREAVIEGEMLKVTWDTGFGHRDMSLKLRNGKLHSETINVYNDNRQPRRSQEVFIKET